MNDLAAYEEVAVQATNEDLIVNHMNLVKKIAYHLLSRLPQSIQLQDLIQSGVVGLIEASKNYRPDRGSSFETFAGFRVRGAMLDDIRKGDWVPRSVYQNARKITQAIHEIEKKHGREAKPQEIADLLEVSLEKYHKMLGDTGCCDLFSLDEMHFETQTLSNSENNPMDNLQNINLRKLVKEQIALLPDREQLILSLYNNDELTLKDIGKILEISESRVSQIHSQAISRLRARIKSLTE